VVLEHDLGITVERDLLSVDDCIHSSMVFLRKAIVDMRLMLEMHYFFFVDNSGSSNSASQSTSPLVISGQLIPEMEEPEEEDEDEEGDDEQDDSADDNETVTVDLSQEKEQHSNEVQETTKPPQSVQSAQSGDIKDRSATTDSNEEMKQLEEQVGRLSSLICSV